MKKLLEYGFWILLTIWLIIATYFKGYEDGSSKVCYRFTFHGDTTYMENGRGLVIYGHMYNYKIKNNKIIPLTDTLKIIKTK